MLTLPLLVTVAVAFILGLRSAQTFTLDDAQAFIGAKLPAGAQAVQFASKNQFARIVWLRFTLPPDTDVPAFIQQMGLEPPLRDGFTPFPQANYTEAELTWWTPHTAPQFSGLYANTGSKVYEMLVDRTDGTQIMIYLRVYAI